MIRNFKIQNPELIISEHAYRKEFHALGLRFGSLRSDTCKKCDAFYVSELDAVDEQEILRIQAESRDHHEKSDTAYKTMYSDIELARLDPSIIVLCVNLQQVIQNALKIRKVTIFRYDYSFNLLGPI